MWKDKKLDMLESPWNISNNGILYNITINFIYDLNPKANLVMKSGKLDISR